MSAANPNPMEKSMVSVLVVANAGGGVAVAVWSFLLKGDVVVLNKSTRPCVSPMTMGQQTPRIHECTGSNPILVFICFIAITLRLHAINE
jgi:hypothetical protein